MDEVGFIENLFGRYQSRNIEVQEYAMQQKQRNKTDG